MENIILIIAGIAVLVIGLYLVKYLFMGAVVLFQWAGESGFIGVVAYFACWVFLFPFMLTGCIITGAVTSWTGT